MAHHPPARPLLGQDLLPEEDDEHDPAPPAHVTAPSVVAPPSPFSRLTGFAASRVTCHGCASPVAGLLPVPLVADDGQAPMRSCSPIEGMDEGCGIQPASPSHITLPNAVVLSNNFWIDGLSLAVAANHQYQEVFTSTSCVDCYG
ncbi:uncharacterized protein [Triticum aestivum]|uniref:uncharacterized protein isoform X2 n=1 Tax=Triticum aestivum TaxID=4565 RepID=UPI001D00FE32|nr:uncharacterized protein LOC123044102 isoform X2 [Triticum aestivum]